MRPYVVVHNAVSVDGRITGFVPDMAQYYGLVSTWDEDATLVGSSTLLVPQEEMPPDEEGDGAESGAESEEMGSGTLPLLVVPDSRGRIKNWVSLRNCGYWRDVLVLCSETTPVDYLDFLKSIGVEYLVLGKEHVDLLRALELLKERGINTVRVDSGGTLVGQLLRQNLVDELSLVIHPTLVGGIGENSIFKAQEGIEIPLELTSLKKLENGLIWVRYKNMMN